MQVYSKIINEETKELECIVCGEKPLDGYSIMDYELAYNGKYYLKGFAPTETEEEKAKRLGNLKLTGADVERGIYQAKGMDFDDILAFVMATPPAGLDVKALRIELKANHFYRGNPYVNAVGSLLGFTSEQLDKFFEYNDFNYLLPKEEPEEPTEEE
jgi:hypothetical protein